MTKAISQREAVRRELSGMEVLGHEKIVQLITKKYNLSIRHAEQGLKNCVSNDGTVFRSVYMGKVYYRLKDTPVPTNHFDFGVDPIDTKITPKEYKAYRARKDAKPSQPVPWQKSESLAPNFKGNGFAMDVLDHGFVVLRNMAGPTRRTFTPIDPSVPDGCGQERAFDADDTDVANAARMSFEGSDLERTYEIEMKLTRFLMANKHMTPFESIEVWLEMKLPIFVARQFVRHRTTSLNEVSGRYVTLPAEWYIPEVVGGKAANAKQGQEDNLSIEDQDDFKETLRAHCQGGYIHYLDALNNGVAPEHARMFLSLNHYTHWLWKQDLRNLMHFLSLRQDAHAQIEARAYGNAIVTLLEPHIPGLMGLYQELVRI